MQNLSLQNYHVMRDHVANPEFLLQKKLERKMQEIYPDEYLPLYSMVTFSDIGYAEAEKRGEEQNSRIKKIMSLYNIEELFENGEIDNLIHQFFIQLKNS
jgi:kynurenine 3-monooxygenase